MEGEMETRPLLSVVIPTRNRIPYAVSAIQSILEIPDRRLELVVQDNSESRELETWVHTSIHDSRLQYRHNESPLSFVGNFNAATEAATGEYVCFIGDDDGVNPEIMEAVEWAREENIDCLAVRQTASYLWPDTSVPSTIFSSGSGGSLTITEFRGSLVEADIEEELRRFLRNGALYYPLFDLPKLYHGIVNRRCLEAVRQKTGAYFGGLSPDIFASLSIACVAQRVTVVDYPLTIPGACKVSGSVLEGSIKRHSKRLEDAPHLCHRGSYEWCEVVPRVYSVETIWADSGIAALRAMGRDDLLRELNLSRLAACCIGANRGIAAPLLRDLFRGLRIMGKNRVIGGLQFGCSLLTGPAIKFARRAWNRFLMMIGQRALHTINGLENMVEVTHALTRHLKENGKSFADCVARNIR